MSLITYLEFWTPNEGWDEVYNMKEIQGSSINEVINPGHGIIIVFLHFDFMFYVKIGCCAGQII